MKKWIVAVIVLACCLVYAMIELSTPQDESAQNVQGSTPSAEQPTADGADETAPGTDAGSAVPAAQVEAVTKVLREFQTCLKDKQYDKAWELTTDFFRQRVANGSFETFKANMAGDGASLATGEIHPESAAIIDGRVGLLVTSPSFEYDLYFCFVEQDGRWKLDIGRPARGVNAATK